MHEPYDDDDDGYEDEYYNYDNSHQYDPFKFYFKFDVSGSPLSKWIQNLLNNNFEISNIPEFPFVSFPVNSWNPSTGKDNSFQYLGSNYHGNQIWKKKYFAIDKINIEYKMHLQSHAKYFILQPTYYKGLFDILN